MPANGQEIAKAYVQVLPTTKGIQAQLTEQLGGPAEKAAGGMRASFLGAIGGVKQAITALPFAALCKSAVDVGQAFDASMSSVYSLMSSANGGLGLTAQQMQTLEDRAREMGAATQFSAKDAAEAMGFMALAGWDTQQVYDAIPDVLNLAAAAGMNLGEASDIVTDYMSAFSNSALTAAQMSDMLAYAQANSNTTVTQLAEAYRNCAATMNAAGQSAHTTTAMLEGMANQGYKGAQAGTALTAIQRDLTAKMKRGTVTLNKQKIAIKDEQGNYRDMIDIMRDVEKATEGMGDAEKAAALKKIFTADSIKGVNLLLNEGIDKIAGYKEELEGSAGSAKKMADILNDNLAGDLKVLKSGFEEMQLSLAKALTPALRAVTQGATDLLAKFNGLPEPMKKIVFGAAGVFSALGPLKLLLPVIKTALAGVNWPLTLLAGGFALAASKSERFQAFLGNLKEAVSLFFQTLEAGGTPMDAFKTAFTKLFGEGAWQTAEGVISTVQGAVSTLSGAFTNAVDGLGTFLGKLMDGEGISAAWEAAKAKFGEFDWAGMASSALESIQAGLGTFGEWLSGMFQTAKENLSTVDWNGVGQAIHDGAVSFLTAGGAWLSAKFEDAKTAVSNIPWAEIGTAILDGVKSVFDAGGQFLAGLFGFGKDAVITMPWSGIGTAIKDGAIGLLDAAGSFLSAPFEAAKTAISGMEWSGIGTAIKDGAIGLLDAAGSFLSAPFEAAKTAISQITWSGVGTAIKDGITTSLTGLQDLLTGPFTAAFDAISSIDWGGVGSTILSGLQGALDGIASIAGGLWEGVKNLFGGQDENPAVDFTQGVEQAMTQAQPVLEASAQALGESATTALNQQFSEEDGRALFGQLANGIRMAALEADFTADIQGVVTQIRTQLETVPLWGETGGLIASGVSKGMGEKKKEISAKAKELAQAAKDKLRAEIGASGSKFKVYGRDIASGIASGIRDNKGEISSALVSAVMDALGDVRKLTGTHSPSRLFAEKLGRWFPAGTAVGIREHAQLVVRAMEDMASRAAQVRAGAAWFPAEGAALAASPGGFTQNLTVNSPRALSPWEVARQTRNATRQLAQSLRG